MIMPEPRRLPRTANEELLNRQIRHMVLLERLKAEQVRLVMSLLDRELMPQVYEKLQTRLMRIANRHGLDPRPATTRALLEAMTATDEDLRKAVRQVYREVRNNLKELAEFEAEWQLSVLQTVIPVTVALNNPTDIALASSLSQVPIEGRLLKDWFEDLSSSAIDRIQAQVNIGRVRGESLDQIMRRVRGLGRDPFGDGVRGQINRHADTIVRTAITHTSAYSRETVYAANTDLIKGVMMVATLDNRTTIFCMSIDGKVYPVNQGPRPPFHMRCRTQSVPVLKSWRELGFDFNELSPGDRASMTGAVPASVTYPEWLRDQTPDIQDEALGPARAKLFREGKVKIDRFLDSRGNTLTLEELRKREGLG